MDEPTTPQPARTAEADPAYQAWLDAQAQATAPPAEEPPAAGPGAADPEYQAYLAEKARQEQAQAAALLDPDYAKWKAAKQAEEDRIAALGPTCPHCHQPLANPSGEALGYCWACGFGSHPDQAARYAEAVKAGEQS